MRHIGIRKELHSIQSSHSSEELPEYIQSLEDQCGIRVDAVKIAQELIAAYRQENHSLKKENKQLKDELLSQQSTGSRGSLKQSQTLQKTILQHSEKISKLLQNNLDYVQKISQLEKELRYAYQEKQRENLANKNSRSKVYEPVGQHSEGLAREDRHREKVMKFKLKQKDEEIFHLLLRLNQLQEFRKTYNLTSVKVKEKNRQERLKSSSTFEQTLTKNLNSSRQSLQIW